MKLNMNMNLIRFNGKKIISAIIIFTMLLSLMPFNLKDSLNAEGKSIDTSSMTEGVIGAEVQNVKMIQCGHEFSFDLILDAKFNESVLTTETKEPFDVVLVFDCSLSMRTPDPTKFEFAKAAAKDVVRLIYDYNTGGGDYSGTGICDNGSRFGFVTYSDSTASMKSTLADSGDRFDVNAGTGDLIDPYIINGVDTINGFNIAYLIDNAIDNVTNGTWTDIADGINNAISILDARTGEYANRPGYIIVMSDGVANVPYNHTPTVHNTFNETINNVLIREFLNDVLGVSNGDQCARNTNPLTHNCSTSGAILRSNEARDKGYTVCSVGFDLTGIPTPESYKIAVETLKMIAGYNKDTPDEDAIRFSYAEMNSSPTLTDRFKQIIDNQIIKLLNPVAKNGLLKYYPPDGFTIKSVQTDDGTYLTTDGKSFSQNIDEIYDTEYKFAITIVANDDTLPGSYPVVGKGSTYSFTNVELNKITVPDWYTSESTTNTVDYSIDLYEWANDKTVTVLPLSQNTSVVVTNFSSLSSTVFTVTKDSLNQKNALFPQDNNGILSGSGDVFADDGTTKIGTFTSTSSGLVITLDDSYAVSPENSLTAKLSYTYSINDQTSCPSELTVVMNVVNVIPDKIVIVKNIVNTSQEQPNDDGQFNFEVVYTPEAPGLPTLYSLTTVNGFVQSTDSNSVIVPDNYSGVVQITEVSSKDKMNGHHWLYDNTVYLFSYESGTLIKVEKSVDGLSREIDKLSVASFINSIMQEVPDIPETGINRLTTPTISLVTLLSGMAILFVV